MLKIYGQSSEFKNYTELRVVLEGAVIYGQYSKCYNGST